MGVCTFGKLVHEHGHFAAMIAFEDVLQKRGLARAEEARQNGNRDLGALLQSAWYGDKGRNVVHPEISALAHPGLSSTMSRPPPDEFKRILRAQVQTSRQVRLLGKNLLDLTQLVETNISKDK